MLTVQMLTKKLKIGLLIITIVLMLFSIPEYWWYVHSVHPSGDKSGVIDERNLREAHSHCKNSAPCIIRLWKGNFYLRDGFCFNFGSKDHVSYAGLNSLGFPWKNRFSSTVINIERNPIFTN